MSEKEKLEDTISRVGEWVDRIKFYLLLIAGGTLLIIMIVKWLFE